MASTCAATCAAPGLQTPILMLTARAQEAEKVLAFESGADDYVTKPFGTKELRARIKALLRRADNGRGRQPDVFEFGDVQVDFTRGEVRRGGQPLDLTLTEFKLLGAFVRNRGRVLSRQQLLDAAWGVGIFALGPRRRQPHRQPAPEDRTRPNGAESHRERARTRLPVRRVIRTEI